MGYKLCGCEVLGCCEIDSKMNEVYIKNHKTKLKIKAKRYLPCAMDNSGYPIDINVEFEDGRVIKYKRGQTDYDCN